MSTFSVHFTIIEYKLCKLLHDSKHHTKEFYVKIQMKFFHIFKHLQTIRKNIFHNLTFIHSFNILIKVHQLLLITFCSCSDFYLNCNFTVFTLSLLAHIFVDKQHRFIVTKLCFL